MNYKKTSICILMISSFLVACSDKNKESSTPNSSTTHQPTVPLNNNQSNNVANSTIIQQEQQIAKQNLEITKQKGQDIIRQASPKVIIPNKPGNVKDLLTTLALKSGYQLNWQLKGYYNLDKKELMLYNQPIGLVLPTITEMMTFSNKTLKIHWDRGNQGEQFPYPLDVAYILCGKSIVLFETPDRNAIPTLLKNPNYSHCSIPSTSLGTETPIIDSSKLNFNEPPPFVNGQTPGFEIDINAFMPKDVQWQSPSSKQPITVTDTFK
jgi:hypothetical protein